jgi:predicted amidohydrolase
MEAAVRSRSDFRAGLLQFRPRFGAREANLARVLRGLAAIEADLVVLPELPFTGYYFRSRAEALALSEPPRASRLVEALVDTCHRRGFHLVTGFAERERDRCYNASLLLGPRGIVRTYRKIQLFDREKRWFDAGDLPLEASRVDGVRVGMMICFDWAFPEIARCLALQGMELLCHPSNLVLPGRCQLAMRARCLENGIFAITANRWGEDRRPQGTLRFTGRSQIVGPRGEVLARAPAARSARPVAAIDPARARDKRVTLRNHLLRDRRPEFYAALLR